MTSLQISDPFVEKIYTDVFNENSEDFIKEIKTFLENRYKTKNTEYKLLQAYRRGELSIGQIAEYLNLTKYDVLDLLKAYNIPFVEVDEEYLKDELEAFNNG